MKYVLFDMDGVLLDSEAGAFEMYQKSLRKIGVEISLEELLEQYVGKTSLQISTEILEKYSIQMTPEEFLKLHRSGGSFYAVSDKVVPMEGVVDFLEFLWENGVRMAAVSSTTSVNVLTALNRMGLLKYFDAVICSDMLEQGKPSPEGYLKALGLLKGIPEECIIIEDSAIGVQAGKNAKITVCAYKGASYQQDTSAADMEVYTYQELKEELIKKYHL